MTPKAKLNPEKLMALANLGADELLKRLAKVPTKYLPILMGICIDKAEQMRTPDQTLVNRILALLDAKLSPRQVARLCGVSVHTVNVVWCRRTMKTK